MGHTFVYLQDAVQDCRAITIQLLADAQQGRQAVQVREEHTHTHTLLRHFFICCFACCTLYIWIQHYRSEANKTPVWDNLFMYLGIVKFLEMCMIMKIIEVKTLPATLIISSKENVSVLLYRTQIGPTNKSSCHSAWFSTVWQKDHPFKCQTTQICTHPSPGDMEKNQRRADVSFNAPSMHTAWLSKMISLNVFESDQSYQEAWS